MFRGCKDTNNSANLYRIGVKSNKTIRKRTGSRAEILGLGYSRTSSPTRSLSRPACFLHYYSYRLSVVGVFLCNYIFLYLLCTGM